MEKKGKFSYALKWGGIMAVALIAISLIMDLAGMSQQSGGGSIINTILSYIISIGAIVMAIKAFKQDNNSNLSIGDGVVLGLLTALVAGLLMAVYTYIYFGYISPDMLDGIRDQSMANAGDMDADQEEMVSGIMDAMMSPGVMAGSVLVMKLFLGLFVGLITGLIMKNENKDYPDLVA